MEEQSKAKSSVKITINGENVHNAAKIFGKKTGNISLTRNKWLCKKAQQEPKPGLKRKKTSKVYTKHL